MVRQESATSMLHSLANFRRLLRRTTQAYHRAMTVPTTKTIKARIRRKIIQPSRLGEAQARSLNILVPVKSHNELVTIIISEANRTQRWAFPSTPLKP